jgi:hypothetical protein
VLEATKAGLQEVKRDLQEQESRTHGATRGSKIQGAMSANFKYNYARDEEIQQDG